MMHPALSIARSKRLSHVQCLAISTTCASVNGCAGSALCLVVQERARKVGTCHRSSYRGKLAHISTLSHAHGESETLG
eukprot:3658700-Amphidinium_carterae.1